MSNPLYRCDLCLEWNVKGNSHFYHWSGGNNQPDQDGFCCHDCAKLDLKGQIERFSKSRANNKPYTNGYLKGHRNHE